MIVINSYGRSGSTVLWKSLGGRRWLWSLKQRSSGIYKSHDYPVPLDMKVVYTFSNPCHVIASVIKMSQHKNWLKKHCDHLKVPFFDISKIYEKDHLRLKKHLNAWLNIPGVAFVRYEAMWNYQKEISDFLQVDVILPEYKQRQSLSERVGVYSELKKQVDNLNDFFIT